MWLRMCEALDKPEWLDDPRFKTRKDRGDQKEALEAVLSEWFALRTTEEAEETLSSHSVPCSPVNTVEQAASDPHVTEREIMMEVPDPVAGTMWVTGKVIKFSRTPMVVGSTPLVGEHTKEVLQDILGYDDDRVRELHETGIVKSVGSTAAAAD
jgi:crotonobetainyl-CoA:carnitine CoA-transferase CaiB-like acyl-CoA transferase